MNLSNIPCTSYSRFLSAYRVRESNLIVGLARCSGFGELDLADKRVAAHTNPIFRKSLRPVSLYLDSDVMWSDAMGLATIIVCFTSSVFLSR